MNVARICSLRAGLPVESAAMTINRFCASGLQSIALAAERIRGGGAEVIVAGGTESMSFVPMGGNKISINPWLLRALSRFLPLDGADGGARGAALRHHARRGRPSSPWPATRRRWPRRRRASSRRRSCRCPSRFAAPDASRKSARPKSSSRWTKGRAPIRRSRRWPSSRPAFHAKGTVTAGNSSQTSDGAAAAVVMSRERAQALGIKPLARFVAFAYAGLPAGGDGDRAGVRHSEGAEAGGTHPGPDRSDRTERGLRGAVAGRHQDCWASTWRRST